LTINGNGRVNGYFGIRNLEPGTVVDKTVVKKKNNDFFLVCVRPARGTSCPTHFEIISNDFDSDEK